MSEPALITVATTEPLSIAMAMSDPVTFVERSTAGFDQVALAQASANGRFAVTHGSPWGLLMPYSDPAEDVASLREMYGEQVAASLIMARQVNGPAALIAWKVFQTVPKGWG